MPSTEKLDVRTYAYPMETLDSQEAVKTVSAVDVEWTETNGRVSAEQLHSNLFSLTSIPIFSRAIFSYPCAFQHSSGPK